MFVKLVVIAGALALANAAYNGPLAGGLPAAQFPAGVNPQSCPNYPNCDSPLVAISQDPSAAAQYPQYKSQNQYSQYQPQPQYQQQYQPQPQPQPQAHFNPISQYNPVLASQYQPQQKSQYSPDVQQALNEGKYIGDGDYHGEGLAEALAPGHTQQYQPQQYQPQPQYQQQQYQAQPQYQSQPQQYNAQPAQIPAGVDARACPNYPFCH